MCGAAGNPALPADRAAERPLQVHRCAAPHACPHHAQLCWRMRHSFQAGPAGWACHRCDFGIRCLLASLFLVGERVGVGVMSKAGIRVSVRDRDSFSASCWLCWWCVVRQLGATATHAQPDWSLAYATMPPVRLDRTCGWKHACGAMGGACISHINTWPHTIGELDTLTPNPTSTTLHPLAPLPWGPGSRSPPGLWHCTLQRLAARCRRQHHGQRPGGWHAQGSAREPGFAHPEPDPAGMGRDHSLSRPRLVRRWV